MPKKTYPWKRFWSTREGRISLADGGYLSDPDSKWGRFYDQDVFAFSSIARIPCLILLGEPGIGKSHALKSEYDDLNTEDGEEPAEKLLIDLRCIGSDMLFCKKLVENDTFVGWKKGSHRLHLFLDSLDECLLRVDTLVALIIDQLSVCPTERLFLRIACRTAEWPSMLEDGLKELWPKDSMGVYELAPLRRIDVIEAATANGLNAESFLHKIDRMEAVPLAIKPVTLDFLINTYRRTGQFPRSQMELYREGCRILCEEVSESRRAAKLTGILSAKQRMRVAARIAAATTFANKYAVSSGLDLGNIPEEDVTISNLSGGSETIDGIPLCVNDAVIREVLDTGLFTSRGLDRMGWAHQTYAEFLAARYLVEKELSLTQMMGLIVHPSDPGKKLVPQLHETAAWLTSMDRPVFNEIMKTDPEVLLRSDIATASAEDRRLLVESLLELLQREELLPPDWHQQRHYRKLAHPGLGAQLTPYLQEKTRSIFARCAGIEIAEACELKDVQNDLARMALDREEPDSLRVEAAHAVWRIADVETKAKLKPLAKGEAGDDPEDRLKGYGLYAAWPNHIGAEELFALLTPPKRESFIGPYQLFVKEELAEHLQPEELPIALGWVAAEERRKLRSDSFEELKDGIMLKAWEHLESPGVLEPFAKAALSRMAQHDCAVRGEHDPPFRATVREDDVKRRMLLGTMAHHMSASDIVVHYIGHCGTPFVFGKDIEWLIGLLKTEESAEIQDTLAQMVKTVFRLNDSAHVNAVLTACQELPVLAVAFEDLIKPIELDSPGAQKLRKQHRMLQKMEQKQEPLVSPPPFERIALLLDEIESGKVNKWWVLNSEMTLEPTSRNYGDEFESDLTALPGWQAADELTRERIVRASRSYVLEVTPDPDKWLGKNILHRPAYAGVRALRLLLEKDPGFVESLSPEIWKRWAVAILTSPWGGIADNENVLRTLVAMAYRHSADEMIQALLLLIRKEDAEQGHISIVDRVEHCWDEKLAEAVFDLAKNEELKPKSVGKLFEELVDHRVKGAYDYLGSLLDTFPSDESTRDRAKAAAEALLHDPETTWSSVWTILKQNEGFGRDILESMSYGDRRSGKIMQAFTEDELAELFIWLTRQYPYEEDHRHDGAFTVSRRDSIAEWRDGILRHLKQRGTEAAGTAIAHMVDELPHLDWLKWTLLDARAIARRQTWTPPHAEEIVKVTSSDRFRLVQDGEQLLEVLCESLKRLEIKLHGETPAVEDLWFPTGKGKFKPQDENMFSNYVKRHLESDLRDQGIIVNREVEIRRSVGPGTGERTDIHVDVAVRHPNGEIRDTIAAIIEVKGCWHSELLEAMQTQLVERYLKENRCQNGLYLVGWYNCDYWDNTDDRRRAAPSLEIAEVRARLERQATELSKEGILIKAFVINTARR